MFLAEGSGRPLAWRAIQGHSRSYASPEEMGWVEIDGGVTDRLWHGTFRRHIDSISRKGLIPGGVHAGVGVGRSEIFFSARDPFSPLVPASHPTQAYKIEK